MIPINVNELKTTILHLLQNVSEEDFSLFDLFKSNEDLLGEIYLFGGVIRDCALYGNISSESDFDFVVSASSEDIEKFLQYFDYKKNKFDGYRFFFGGRQVDIWALDKTWALKRRRYLGNVPSSLLKTTFFTVDAAIYRLNDGMLFLSKNFVNSIAEGVVRINLEENPFPKFAALRANKLNKEKGLDIDKKLFDYIKKHLD